MAQNTTGIDAGGLLPPPPADREWKGSRVAPFSSNVAFVLYRCPSPATSPLLREPSSSASAPARLEGSYGRTGGQDGGTISEIYGKIVREPEDDDWEGGDAVGGNGRRQGGTGNPAVVAESVGRDDASGQRNETAGGSDNSGGLAGQVSHVVRAAYNEHVIQLPGCGGLHDCPLDIFLVRPCLQP